jgi:4-oxalocrotonate tautomerase
MITIQVAAEPSAQLARAIADTVRGLTAEILGKDPSVTAISVEFISMDHWFIAGRSAAELGRGAFFVDTRITDGTNDKDEKARYIQRTFRALSELIPGAHTESYVHVDDVRGDAYGYGGLTQDRRYIASRSLEA